MPVETSITNEQKIKLNVNPTTTAGISAPIDGGITVTVISGDSTFVPDPADQRSGWLVSSDTPGDTTFLVEADADMTPDQPDGSGKQTIQDTVTLHVVGAMAANLGVNLGAVEVK